jgi:hypothetical protein
MYETYKAFRLAFCLSSSKYLSFFSLQVAVLLVGSRATPSGLGNCGNSNGFLSAGNASDWDGVGIGIIGLLEDEDDASFELLDGVE